MKNKIIIGEEIKYFECSKCGAILCSKRLDPKKYVSSVIVAPNECYEKQGGCGRVSIFREVTREWVEKNHPELLKGEK